MARTSSNFLLRNLRGAIGKQIVIKKYGKKTVVAAYPDMSGVKPSALQKVKRSIFKDAAAHAQAIIRDPKKKAAYAAKLRKGKSVYHAAIREYMKQHGGK